MSHDNLCSDILPSKNYEGVQIHCYNSLVITYILLYFKMANIDLKGSVD